MADQHTFSVGDRVIQLRGDGVKVGSVVETGSDAKGRSTARVMWDGDKRTWNLQEALAPLTVDTFNARLAAYTATLRRIWKRGEKRDLTPEEDEAMSTIIAQYVAQRGDLFASPEPRKTKTRKLTPPVAEAPASKPEKPAKPAKSKPAKPAGTVDSSARAAAIKADLAAGMKVSEIAAKHGVSSMLVYNIRNGKLHRISAA